MTWSRIPLVSGCLLVLTLWLAVACAPSAPTPTTPSTLLSVRLFTRTPTPTVTPTPTPHPQALYQEGLQYRNAWDLETALESFDRALSIAPSAPFYASRSEVYRLMGRYEEAAADIEQALALAPDLAEAWRQKALLSRTQMAWDEALASANKLIEFAPDDGAAYILRAQIYVEGFGELQQALSDYDQAIAHDPIFDKATLVERWHILAELGEWEQALLVSQKITTTGSEDPLRYYYRGWSLTQLGRQDAAIQMLLFGIQRYPDYPVALYYALGVAYCQRQAWTEAVQSLEVALSQSSTASSEIASQPRLHITDADILGWMGVAYLGLKQCETGAALVERAIAEGADPVTWTWARERVEACYVSLTPTPTPGGTPTP